MKAGGVRAVAVIVPARDEEALLGRCLFGISAAVEHLRAARAIDVAVTIVLDSCTDGSAGIVAELGFDGVVVEAGNVGVARRAAVDASLARLSRTAPAETWIASTDADSFVPPSWLTNQLDLADAGWDVVLGSVLPDIASLPEAAQARAAHAAALGDEIPVHGANLGVRASAYAAAGGFPPIPEHEDVQIVAALRSTGARIISTQADAVLTSARFEGRTPGGYAEWLRLNLTAST